MRDQRAAAGDIERRLANISRIGTVEVVTHSPPRVRVRIGGILTAPIPWFVGAAGATRVWSSPTVGEQVMVLAPSGDMAQGVVMRGIYSGAAEPPSDNPDVETVVFSDGSSVTYDSGSGTLTVDAKSKAVVVSPDVRLGSAGASDPVVRRSDLQAAIDGIKAIFDAHTHAGVTPGPGATATPLPPLNVTAQGSAVTSSD